MKQGPSIQADLFAKFPLILWLATLLLLVGCDLPGAGGLVDFEGVVVGKRERNQILVVPNITAADLVGQSDEEVLALAIEQGGVYFSVDQLSFATASVGRRVMISYDPVAGQEPTTPPRRFAQGVEFVDE